MRKAHNQAMQPFSRAARTAGQEHGGLREAHCQEESCTDRIVNGFSEFKGEIQLMSESLVIN